MSAFKYLTVRRENGVEHLVLNRPEVRNAFNEDLIGELAVWARRAAEDAALRAVVISGAGPVFCAGGDLKWMSKMIGYSHGENIRDASVAAQMFAAIDALPVPVIARVHGAAIGGGAGLAAVADIAVTEVGASFGFTEVKLGLVPALIAPYVLAKIGPSAARELFLTGRRFNSERALQIGLVHSVVASADELDAAVNVYLEDFLGSGREAIAVAKQLIRQAVLSSARAASTRVRRSESRPSHRHPVRPARRHQRHYHFRWAS
jgi:methylglutaconyl-CoA hydratase